MSRTKIAIIIMLCIVFAGVSCLLVKWATSPANEQSNVQTNGMPSALTSTSKTFNIGDQIYSVIGGDWDSRWYYFHGFTEINDQIIIAQEVGYSGFGAVMSDMIVATQIGYQFTLSGRTFTIEGYSLANNQITLQWSN